MTGRLLEVQGLSKRFGGVAAVNAVDLTVDEREIVGLIGPNGAGKTTLFGMVTGFLKPTAGTVHFRGADISSLAPHRRAMLGIVCTFQKTAIFRDVTVLEAVRMGQHRRTSASVLDALVGTSRHRREEEANSRARRRAVGFCRARPSRRPDCRRPFLRAAAACGTCDRARGGTRSAAAG